MDSRAGPKDGGCFEQAEVRIKKLCQPWNVFFIWIFSKDMGYIYIYTIYLCILIFQQNICPNHMEGIVLNLN